MRRAGCRGGLDMHRARETERTSPSRPSFGVVAILSNSASGNRRPLPCSPSRNMKLTGANFPDQCIVPDAGFFRCDVRFGAIMSSDLSFIVTPYRRASSIEDHHATRYFVVYRGDVPHAPHWIDRNRRESHRACLTPPYTAPPAAKRSLVWDCSYNGLLTILIKYRTRSRWNNLRRQTSHSHSNHYRRRSCRPA